MQFVFAKGKSDEKNINVAFQNAIKIDKGSYRLRLAALNVYRLFVNDVFIMYGPSRSAHGYLQVDEINIDCTSEHNYLTIEVVGNNINSYCFCDEKPKFAIELLKNDEVLLETKDFNCYLLNDRVRKVQRYSFQRCFTEVYNYLLDRSSFYLGDSKQFPLLELEIVEAPTLLTRKTPLPFLEKHNDIAKVENGSFSIDDSLPIWNDRAIDNISPKFKGFKKSELEVFISDEVSKFVYKKTSLNDKRMLNSGEYFIFDTKRTLTGFLELKVSVLQKTNLYVIFDEVDFKEAHHKKTDGINVVFSRNDTSNIIKYSFVPGSYHVITFEPYSMRYIKLIVQSGSLIIDDINFIKFENHEMYKLKFTSSDKDIDLIIKAAQNTLAQNAVDILMDCPSRERAGWLCDSWFSSRAELIMSGSNKIEKNFLDNYALSPQLKELPKGMIPMNYPGDHLDGVFIPNWSMWYVIELYDYLLRTGDEKLIHNSKDKVEGLINYFEQFENEYGLLENLQSWVFIEWSEANNFVNGVNFPSNMIYSLFLKRAFNLYGNNKWLEKSKRLVKTINDLSFNGIFYEDNMVRNSNNELIKTGNISETCQYYAFFTEVASIDTHNGTFDILVNEFGRQRNQEEKYPNVHKSNSFIGNYLRLEMLKKYKYYQKVFDDCKDFFLYMAERTGTLWEHKYVHGSLNHGFASYAANLIIESISGITFYEGKNKILYLTEPKVNIDFKAFIPIDEGIYAERINGKLKIRTPKNIKVVQE